MIIFYDPNNGNQVMAVYSHDTESPVWENRGFLRAEVVNESFKRAISRDRKVSVIDWIVAGHWASTNPEQPIPAPSDVRLSELYEKLRSRTFTQPEQYEMLALERGL